MTELELSPAPLAQAPTQAFPQRRRSVQKPAGSDRSTRPQWTNVASNWHSAAVRVLAILVFAVTLDVCSARAAYAIPGIAPPATNSNERSRVAFAVFGDLSSMFLDTLTRLLEPEMAQAQLSLNVSEQNIALRVWVDSERKDPRALLVAALDVQQSEVWRLVLVDAARGRAVIRDLPGGVARDRAVLEAVGNMVASAAQALQEGLEVASRSVDDALSETASPKAVAPAPVLPPPPPPPVRTPLRVRGAAGFGLASFERRAPVSFGVSVELAALVEQFGLALTLARYSSQELATTPGSFEIDRTAFSVAALVRREWGALAGEVGIGAAGELLQRSETVANSGAPATPRVGGSDLVRYGPLVELAGRLRIAPRISLSIGSGSSYFPQRISYLESGTPTRTALASPWLAVAFGRVAFEVLLP